jgi:WD40 repeat protein
MNKFCDAFISYGRPDSLAFGRKLHARLLEVGFKVWFDQNDIPLGVDFQNQIDDGIEKAHNFLFIIAPHSVNSEYCRKEIELAIKRNKRIIPLLHVEQISRETWQQRYPHGTDEEWEAYKAKGKHTVFQNMHPTIGKINWVYFREEQDDFEKSFAGLINLLRSHTDYVEQHTRFLAKALEWERHQKQTSYLLIGEERQQAETWLKIRFKDDQPPCTPSDLHCEYITESIKNANNLMTQVFLSYADEDRTTMEKIRNSLRRESITVWTNRTDIQTGEAFDEAIKRGIEQADNLVFLLSPDSVNSTYCQRELDLAVSLHKRIIPVLVRSTEPNQVPSVLPELQYIDLTDNVLEDDYLLDESQLLKILHEDAAYYNEHKVLLTKALKWKRQHENPSILLRGYNLRSADTWLKVALKRTQHPPIPLQEEFIAESLRQPPAESLDVFVSYSRADADFARKLNDSLQIQGKTTWFDQESIASGSDFQQEIYRGIKACDNFLFILSPRSVNSPYCKDEVEYAASLNKRFVTVLHREVNPSDLHPELAKVQWIDFNHNERDFNANFNQLVRTLDTDREHVQSHTKWLQRAIEWEHKGKSVDLLLRGNEYVIAQNWLQEAEQKNKRPAATPLQKEFLLESGNAIAAQLKKEKRQVLLLKSSLVVIGLVAVLAGFSAWQAYLQQEKATQAQKKAEKSLTDQVDALSRFSKNLANSEQKFDALIEGIRAGKELFNSSDDKSKRQVEKALREALYALKEDNRLGGQDTTVVKFSPDNETIATADKDGKVRLWAFEGKNSKTLRHGGEVTDILFSPGDGKIIATLGKDKTVKLWSRDGKELASLPEKKNVSDVALSPDGKLIATFSEEGNNQTGKLWKLEGQELKDLLPKEKFNDVSFSPDGKLIATNGAENTTKLWKLNGDRLNSFNPLPSNEKFDYLSLSPEHKIIFTFNFDEKTLKLWSLDGKKLQFPLTSKELATLLLNQGEEKQTVQMSSDGKMLATFKDNEVKLWHSDGKEPNTLSHKAEVTDVWFSPDNQIIVTASKDTMVKLWKQNGEPIATLPSHSALVDQVSFSPDGNTIATASFDKTVKLWNKEGKELQTLHPGTSVDEVRFSSDDKIIATLSKDNTVKLWKFDNSDRQFLNHGAPVNSISFSADGKLIATREARNNQTAKLWIIEDKSRKILPLSEKFNDAKFSPDGKLMASFTGEGDNQTGKLWSVEGKQLQPLPLNEKFNSVEFSPDGKLMASFSGEGNNQTGKLWSVEGKQLQPLPFNENFNSVEFSPNGKLMASFPQEGDKQTGKLWSVEGKQLQPLPLNENFNSVEFSPDGKLMASFTGEGDKQTGKLWSVEGKQLQPLPFNEKFNSVEFSPDGKLIATTSKSENETRIKGNNQTGKLWSIEGKQLQSLPFNEKFNSVKFSPDGKLIAIFQERTIKFWTRDGKPLPNLLGDQGVRAHIVEFSPDGKWIASADRNNTIKLWNPQGEELATLNLNDSINKLSFSPDSKILAIASNEKMAILWRLDRDEWKRVSDKELNYLVNEACIKVGNYLKRKPKQDSDRTLCEGIGQK